MKATTLKKLLGFSPDDVKASGPFVIFRDAGDGPEQVAKTKTFEAACKKLSAAFFRGELPNYDQEVIDDMPVIEGEKLDVRALVYELSPRVNVDRKKSSKKLAYLASVLEDRPQLRLVVAWEAASPRQDFALGIFSTVPK